MGTETLISHRKQSNKSDYNHVLYYITLNKFYSKLLAHLFVEADSLQISFMVPVHRRSNITYNTALLIFLVIRPFFRLLQDTITFPLGPWCNR